MPGDRRSEKRITVYRADVPDSDELWEVEYEAVAEAIHFACRDLREGRRIPREIIDDGVLLYDADAIAELCRERADEREAASEGSDTATDENQDG
jgi:hypothetical protein